MRQTNLPNQAEEIKKKITQVIETEINPRLSAHMGGALLSAYEDGTAYIKFTGSCRGCYAADDTMENVVRPALLNQIPQLRDVVLDDSVSEELLDFARSLMRHDTPGGER